MTGLPYAERRGLREGLGLAGPAWSTPAAIVGHGAQAREMVRNAGLEGLLAKRLTSRYEPGVRSKSCIKIRFVRTADVVVGGWAPGRGRLTGLPGAVLVGEQLGGQLHYAGSVGTGWSRAERTRLAGLLHAAAIDTCPFAEIPPVAGARRVPPVWSARSATRPAPAPDVCATPRGTGCAPTSPRRPHLIPSAVRRPGLGASPTGSALCRLAHGLVVRVPQLLRPETTLRGSSVCQKGWVLTWALSASRSFR